MIITGHRASRNKPLTRAEKEVNRLASRERAANERDFGGLKGNFTRLRLNPQHATTLLRALLILTNSEISR